MQYSNLFQKILYKTPPFLFTFFAFSAPYAQTKEIGKAPKRERPIRLDWDEIRSPPVGFQNYSVKPAPAFMRDLDKEQGETLAREIRNKKNSSRNGLRVQRIFNPEKAGLGADIISIRKKIELWSY